MIRWALLAIFAVAQGATLEEARQMVDSGRLQDAIRALATIQDDRPEISHLRGIALFRMHDYPGAIESFTKSSAQEKPESTEIRESLLLLGQCNFLSGQMAGAIAALESAARNGVRSNELFYMLGIAYISRREPEKAVRSIASLFAVEPESAAAHVLTSQMMMRHEFEELAAKQAERAIELDPKVAGAHYLLGEIAVFRGDVDGAIAQFRLELAVNPNSSATYYKMGDAYTRREDWDRAIPFLQRAVWLNPDFSGPYILLGKAYFKRKDYPNAEGMLRQALRMDPQNTSAYYLLGQTLVQSGRLEEGRKMLERSQELRHNEAK